MANPEESAERRGAHRDAPPSPMDGTWDVQTDTEAVGPIRISAILQMIEQRSINELTGEGRRRQKWSALCDVPELNQYLSWASVDRSEKDSFRSSKPAREIDIVYAGFWIRLVAYVADFIILSLMLLCAGAVVGIAFAAQHRPRARERLTVVSLIIRYRHRLEAVLGHDLLAVGRKDGQRQ
jgi:hypothetical protein